MPRPVKQICKECGKVFLSPPSWIKRGRGKFCSKRCLSKWQSQAFKGENGPSWKGGLTNRICQECGGEFVTPPSWVKRNRGKFCSKQCSGKYNTKRLWQTSKYREKVIKNALKGLMRRPTSLERKFIDFCRKYTLPFKYCGDGSLLIGYKNPDFVETNGKKICIEVAGKFFPQHNPPDRYERERVNHFAKHGWKCLVLWDDEIFQDKHYRIEVDNWEGVVLNKVQKFCGGE